MNFDRVWLGCQDYVDNPIQRNKQYQKGDNELVSWPMNAPINR